MYAEAKKDSELLKLLFVGITRAKYALTLSFADKEDSRANQLTKYLSDFENWDFEKETFEYKEDDFTREFFRSISRDVFDNQKALVEEIKERVDNITLSPSRLNDYLECPRKFFYVKVLGIDVEDSNWDNANFGTVIHKILEDSVRIAKEKGEYPSAQSVVEEFNKIIDTERFSTPQAKEKFEKRGMDVIEKFYPHFANISPDRIEDVEFDFYGAAVDGNKISGKIDRIEKNTDGTYCLYDYKTGRPASESKFAPGEDKEGYYNQLCFYKYAFEKLSDKKVSQVGIIYVEDHTKSVYKELYGEDMEYIENKIKDTYKNIKDLKFNPVKETRDGPCQFCAYKHLCRLDII